MIHTSARPPVRQRPVLRVAFVAALAMALVAASSCSRNQGDRVAILGDSLVTFDEKDLQHQLGKDFELVISGNFGKQVLGAVPAAEVVAATDADQVVINLGTNDVRAGVPVDQSMAALRAVIGLYPGARCIHLVNINEHMVDEVTKAPSTDAARRFNAALADPVTTDDRLDVIDWNGEVEDTLDDAQPPTSTLTTDSVHLTPEGNKIINGLYADAIRGC